jgi:AraC-like DNA-binding protein
MTWLFQWRMQLALRRLRSGAAVANVAAGCGYATESGFAKAFARHFGYGPGAARRSARD